LNRQGSWNSCITELELQARTPATAVKTELELQARTSVKAEYRFRKLIIDEK